MSEAKHAGETGFVAEWPNRIVPGQKVTIYRAEEQGIDVDGLKFAVVCDEHGSIIGETHLPGAVISMKNPDNFCEGCREAQKGASK